MLQLRETRIVRNKHEDVLPGVVIAEEGIALVFVKDAGTTKVQPSTGAAGEVFAGVSLSRNIAPASLPFVQEGAVANSGSVELVRAPIAGQLNVKVNGTQATIVNTAPANAGEVQVQGRNLVFHASAKGDAYTAQFMYAPTVVEARAVIGDGPIGGLASTAESVIGVLKDAQVGTNFYDASADWSDAMFVKLGANGTFTVGTAQDHVPGVIVKNAPNSGNPFLVISIMVA